MVNFLRNFAEMVSLGKSATIGPLGSIDALEHLRY
jgi:hypothetical protein